MPMPAAQLYSDDQTFESAPLGDVRIREPLHCVVLAAEEAQLAALHAYALESRFAFTLTPVVQTDAVRSILRDNKADLVMMGRLSGEGDRHAAVSLAEDARSLGIPVVMICDGLSDAEVAEALRTGMSDVLTTKDLASARLDQAVESALRRNNGPAADQLAMISNLQAENETLRRIAIRNMRLLKGQTMPLMALSWRMMKGEQIREEERARYVKGLARATRNVAGLIDDTVIVAATHRAQDVEENIDLNTLVEDLVRDDTGEILNSRAHVVVRSLPVLWARGGQMQMLFEELLLTAVRNGRIGRVPEIEIGSNQDEEGNPVVWMLEKGLQLSARKQALAGRSDLFATVNGSEFEDSHSWSLCQRLVERNHGQFRISSDTDGASRLMMRFPKRILVRPAEMHG